MRKTNGQHIGYVRVSSVDQHTDRQLEDLEFDRVFTDKCSGASTDRPELARMLSHVREGDCITVHSIDRLARSTLDLQALVYQLREKGVSIRFIKENLEFSGSGDTDPRSKLMFDMLSGFAEFERSMIRERQREGIALAKMRGVYRGRVKTVDDDAIRAELAGGLSMRKTAVKLRVSLSTVQRAARGVK